MIRKPRNLTLRISRTSKNENESEKAARKFFGTFISDIKRNWTDIAEMPNDFYKHLKIKGKSNATQLTDPL